MGTYIIAKCKSTSYTYFNTNTNEMDTGNQRSRYTIGSQYPFYKNSDGNYEVLKCDFDDGVARSFNERIFNQMFDIVAQA